MYHKPTMPGNRAELFDCRNWRTEAYLAPRWGQVGADGGNLRFLSSSIAPQARHKTYRPFAKPSPKPRRKRAKSAKTVPKTVLKTVKALNKRPNFRMFDVYAAPFLFDGPSCAPAWHDPRGSPYFVRKPRHCSGNHPRWPAASARIRSRTPQTRWPAADSAALANRERSIGQERAGRSRRVSRIPGRTVL